MKKISYFFLISCFSLTIISCGDEKEEYTKNEEEYTKNSVSTTDETTSSAVTVSGKVQKGLIFRVTRSRCVNLTAA